MNMAELLSVLPEEVLADEELFVEWAGKSITIAHSAASGKKTGAGKKKSRRKK